MCTSSPDGLDFQETCGLRSPKDWCALHPQFAPPASTLSTSSWPNVLSITHTTTNFNELCDEGKKATKLSPNSLRADILPQPPASIFEATENKAVGKSRPQETERDSTYTSGDTNANPTALNNVSNQLGLDKALPIYLPRRYDQCPVDHMVELISHILAEVIAVNGSSRIISGKLTRFHSRTIPGISVRDYLHRLATHAALAPSLLLVMVYYIDRLCILYPRFSMNPLTAHRFLIAAATVAAKGLSDKFLKNGAYALVGGIDIRELNMLEVELLTRLNWRVVPDPEDLMAYYQGLIERLSGYELEPAITKETITYT